jgi:hypothetical protein
MKRGSGGFDIGWTKNAGHFIQESWKWLKRLKLGLFRDLCSSEATEQVS